MKKVLLIISGVLGLAFVIAILTVLIVSDSPTIDETRDTSTTSATEAASNDYWRQRLSQLTEQTATVCSTTTTTAAKTTTTERSRFTAYTGTVTLPRKHTTSTRRETSTTKAAGKTTRTLTQSEKDMVYGIVYNAMMKEYNDKLLEQQKQQDQIAKLKNEIAGLQKQASNLYVQYQSNLQQLTTRCEAMGMSTTSGYYKAQKESLETQYKSNLSPISEKIDKLQKQVKDAEATLETVKEPTKEEIWQAYLVELEKYQLRTLS